MCINPHPCIILKVPSGYLFILLLVPVVASVAGVISTLFGQSFQQFQLAESLQGNILGIFPFMLFILFFWPVPEELGWRGYWLDSLRTQFNCSHCSRFEKQGNLLFKGKCPELRLRMKPQ